MTVFNKSAPRRGSVKVRTPRRVSAIRVSARCQIFVLTAEMNVIDHIGRKSVKKGELSGRTMFEGECPGGTWLRRTRWANEA